MFSYKIALFTILWGATVNGEIVHQPSERVDGKCDGAFSSHEFFLQLVHLSEDFTDCYQPLVLGLLESGVFQVNGKDVYCDMDWDGGGWLVIARSTAAKSVSFDKPWDDYVLGFGDLRGEHWLGLEFVRTLASSFEMSLQVRIWNSSDVPVTAVYGTFELGSAKTNYTLKLGAHDAATTHLLTAHNGQPFVTHDHSTRDALECVYHPSSGGWWYSDCYSLLPHRQGKLPVDWEDDLFSNFEMMLRPRHYFSD